MSDVLGEGFDPFAELPDDGLEGVVVAEEEVPPDPGVIVDPGRYGKGRDGVLLDGVPVGLWLEREHPGLDGGEVERLLVARGLDERHAAWFAGHRAAALESRAEIQASPAMRSLSEAESRAEERTRLVRDAFLKAQAKK